MSLRTEYDTWHQRIYDAAPDHDDASSPWYRLVLEYLGDVSGLSVLEIACGRGGLVRWHALESSRGLRKLLSPFAYTYFIAAEKVVR